MNPTTVRILFALFILAHGWVHMSLAQVPVPQPGALRTPSFPAWWRSGVDPSWPASRFGFSSETTRTLGWVLWLVVVILYTLGTVALVFFPAVTAVWQGLAVGASAFSLVLLGLYWHPWLPVGVIIDLALLAGVLFRLPILQFGQ